MNTAEKITQIILSNIKKAQNSELLFEEIYKNTRPKTAKNEFLFFLKPEITLKSQDIKLEKIINLILSKISDFQLNIDNIKILSAEYLEKYNIIARHYGVINKNAVNATKNMSETAKEKFKEIYGISTDEAKIYGALEFAEKYKNFTMETLDYLWQNNESEKLAGGTYCERINIDNDTMFLINGFHPRQLKHFTLAGRNIVVMTLSGDLDWSDARTKFVGATNPFKAEKGSIRRELLDNKNDLGLPEVSQSANGVHLSAGPVEALVELQRYNSNFADEKKIKSYSEFSFGKLLEENFNAEQIEKITGNINLKINDKSISVFDFTEEKNSDEAIKLLMQNL